MATNAAQKKWRNKHRYVKTQLNVMARKQIHEDLDDFAGAFHLRGKGEAVTFATFVTRPLSAACLAIALFLLLSPLLPALRKRREVVAMEEVA